MQKPSLPVLEGLTAEKSPDLLHQLVFSINTCVGEKKSPNSTALWVSRSGTDHLLGPVLWVTDISVSKGVSFV